MTIITRTDGTTVAKIEFTSIHALLTYAAYTRKTSEEFLRTEIALHFGIADIDNLPGCDYDAVVQFLASMPKRAI